MNDDKLHMLIKESLEDEVKDIKMSSSLKERIRKNTTGKNRSLYEKFVDLLNTTIEVPIPAALAVCVVIVVIAASSFTVTSGMKKDKSIMGYTSVKAINIGGMNVYAESSDEGGKQK